MTRTGKAARLAGHIAESFIDIHPQDALKIGVREGELARVSSQWGAMVARVQHGGGIARGGVFIPIHWNGQTASDARVGTVVNPAVDPVSGEPEFKHTPVRVERFGVSWHGFVLSRSELALENGFASRIEPASTDKDAFIVAHPGAAEYINDESKSFFERYSELIYVALAALSIIGSMSGEFLPMAMLPWTVLLRMSAPDVVTRWDGGVTCGCRAPGGRAAGFRATCRGS